MASSRYPTALGGPVPYPISHTAALHTHARGMSSSHNAGPMPYMGGPQLGAPPGASAPAPRAPYPQQSQYTYNGGYSGGPAFEQPMPAYPQYQQPTSRPLPIPGQGQHLPAIPQYQQLSNAQMRSQSYSQPQYLSGSYQGQAQYLDPRHASTPGHYAAGFATQNNYPFGEPLQRPSHHASRRASDSSYRSNRDSRHSDYHHRRSSEYDNSEDAGYDSVYDSDEERRQRKKERHRKRREAEAAAKEPHRPTLGDSMYAVFDSFRDAISSKDSKH